MQYRPEIDGLRAVAVVPVILFHAGVELLGGGFVGVDIFFVISGYLITSILVTEIEEGRFSIARFYERRARRILPSLFVVMAACLPFAWAWMLPQKLDDLGGNLAAVSLFASNILLWFDTDYFGGAAEEKPLLHTWSLAVEEQYYLVFPVFLMMAWRFGRRPVFWAIVIMSVFSMGIAEWTSRNAPSAGFYLFPARAWELFAGSICAFIVGQKGVGKNDALALAGLAAIVASIFVFDGETPFPSIYALLPVGGAALIILYGGAGTLTARLLGLKPMVAIGLISYSLYLWHQPLFAFARIRTADEPAQALMLALAALAVVLAIASYYFVEQPFRGKGALLRTRARVFAVSIIGLLIFIALGLAAVATSGFPGRFTPQQNALLEYLEYPREEIYRERECFLQADQQAEGAFPDHCWGDGEILVWGDSHAAALWAGLQQEIAGRGHAQVGSSPAGDAQVASAQVGQANASACPPLTGFAYRNRPFCDVTNAKVLEAIAERQIGTVLMHAEWVAHGPDVVAQRIDQTITALKSAGVRQIVLIGSVPNFHPSLPERMMTENGGMEAGDTVSAQLNHEREIDALLMAAAARNNVAFLGLLDGLCTQDQCLAVIESDGARIPITWDDDHLTREGSAYVAREIVLPQLEITR